MWAGAKMCRVVLGGAGGEHDDRHRRLRAQRPAQLDAAEPGQHQVQDDQVGLSVARLVQRLGPRPRELGSKPIVPQVDVDGRSRLRVVFDDEDPARAGHGLFYGQPVKRL
jgi:hypothetical protein